MGSSESKLQTKIHQLRVTANLLRHEHTQCEQRANDLHRHALRAVQCGREDNARAYQESERVQRVKASEVLRLSLRLQAISESIAISAHLNKLSSNMKRLVSLMSDGRKLSHEQLSKVMQDMEKEFTAADGVSNTMESSMAAAVGVTDPAAVAEDKVAVEEMKHEHEQAVGVHPATAVSSATTTAAPAAATASAAADSEEEQSMAHRMALLSLPAPPVAAPKSGQPKPPPASERVVVLVTTK